MRKPSELLRAAAEEVFLQEYDPVSSSFTCQLGGCSALQYVVRSGEGDSRRLAKGYFEFFCPSLRQVFWFDSTEHRILSLLMAAEIAESEGD